MATQRSILEELQDSYDPVSAGDIKDLERDLGAKLPSPYRRFLLKHNGGHFRHEGKVVCPLREPTTQISEFSPDGFFAVNAAMDHNDIRWYVRVFRGRIPRQDVLAVGRSWEDIVCLALGGEDRGKVYFWEKSNEPDPVLGRKLYLIADDFFEFIRRIVPSPDRDEPKERLPIFRSVERGDRAAVQRYIRAGGDVNARNAEGLPLLIRAIRSEWPKIAELLVAHGADVSATDPDGRAPLVHAFAIHSIDSMRLLLAAGANPNTRTAAGKRILDILGPLDKRAAELLKAHGARKSGHKGGRR